MKYLYLPIEFTSRELDGISLLAIEALRRSISVVIGPRYQILEILKSLPSGVYFCKSIRASEYNDLVKVKTSGHKLVWQDQEGLVQYKICI